MRHVLAYDLGGTNVRCGIINEDGEILGQGKMPTGEQATPEDVAARMAEMAGACLGELKMKSDDLACIGIGSPGPLDSRTGVIIETPNLGWVNAPLAKLVEDALQRPTFLENDANSACWGEFWKGAGRDVQTMFILTLGTGVGGGLILDGKLWKGIDDIAGHLGHIIVDPNGPKQVFDNPGSAEALCSASACIRDARKAAEEHPDCLLAKVPADEITGLYVEECAHKGDAQAIEIYRRIGYHLGVLCASLANALNPELGVLAGGLALSGDLLLKPLRKELKRRALKPAGDRLEIKIAELKDDAGMVGAAGLALLRLDGKL